MGSLGQAGTVVGKEGTAGVRWTSGDTRMGAGFDRDTCSAGFFKNRGEKQRSFCFNINFRNQIHPELINFYMNKYVPSDFANEKF